MRFKHVFEVHSNGSEFKETRELLDMVNSSMAGFGFDEKLDLDIPLADVTITSSNKLTKEEIPKAEEAIKKALEEKVNKKLTVSFKEVTEVTS